MDVTETLDSIKIDELKAAIDRGLGSTKERQLIAASEVADLLLDIRLLLAEDEAELESCLLYTSPSPRD